MIKLNFIILLAIAVVSTSAAHAINEKDILNKSQEISIDKNLLEAVPQEYSKAIKEIVGEIDKKITILAFIKDNCPDCEVAMALFRDFKRIFPKNISLRVVNGEKSDSFKDEFEIDFLPSFVFLDEDYNNRGIKFVGAPKGHALNVVVASVKLFGTGNTDLTDNQKKMLANIDMPSLIEIIGTPGCPHCPGASINANLLAFDNNQIKAYTIDATQNSAISKKYRVTAVPAVVYNQKDIEIGSAPVEVMIQKLNQ